MGTPGDGEDSGCMTVVAWRLGGNNRGVGRDCRVQQVDPSIKEDRSCLESTAKRFESGVGSFRKKPGGHLIRCWAAMARMAWSHLPSVKTGPASWATV